MNFGLIEKALKKTKSKKVSDRIARSLSEGVEQIEADERKKSSGMFYISHLGRCMRKLYFERVGTAEELAPEADLLYKFHAGKDAGQRAVRYLRRANGLFGLAQCVEGHTFEALTVPNVCPTCGMELFYAELGIRDVRRRISGKVDLFYKDSASPDVYLVEVKSASTFYKVGEKKNVQKFLTGNIRQANMYIGLIRAYLRAVAKKQTAKLRKMIFFNSSVGNTVDPLPLFQTLNLNKFIMLYEDKNSNSWTPHEFNYDHAMYLEDIAYVKKFFEYVDSDKLPPKCSEAKECKYCDHKEKCK